MKRLRGKRALSIIALIHFDIPQNYGHAFGCIEINAFANYYHYLLQIFWFENCNIQSNGTEACQQ